MKNIQDLLDLYKSVISGYLELLLTSKVDESTIAKIKQYEDDDEFKFLIILVTNRPGNERHWEQFIKAIEKSIISKVKYGELKV
ncbi:MAG: hypothetical protein QW156_05015 [Candidatus Aenigmatarchaeota archaeon]